MFEDEEDSTGVLSLLGELSSGGYTTPEAQEYARGILDQNLAGVADYTDHEQGILDRMRGNADSVREALREARQRVAQSKFNNAELWLAASAGFGAPTRTGSFGETIGNVSRNLIDPIQRRSQFQTDRDNRLTDLDIALAGVDDGVLSAEMQLAQLARRSRGDLTKEALRTLGRRVGGGGNATTRIRDERIAELAQRYVESGINPRDAVRTATDVVDSNVRLSVIPEIGAVAVLDEVNRTAYEIPLRDAPPWMLTQLAQEGQIPQEGLSPEEIAAQPSDGIPTAQTESGYYTPGVEYDAAGVPITSASLWELAELATGLGSAIRNVGDVAVGVTGLDDLLGVPRAEATNIARQILLGEQNNLIRAMSINPRFPVGEMERLRREVAIEPAVLDDPVRLRNRMIGLQSYLLRRLAEVEAGAANTRMPREQRSADLITARDIRAFLDVMSIPEDANIPTVGGSTAVRPPAEDAPPGVDPIDWQYMTPDERALWSEPEEVTPPPPPPRRPLERIAPEDDYLPPLPDESLPPPGVDPEDWKYMTPEERALWN